MFKNSFKLRALVLFRFIFWNLFAFSRFLSPPVIFILHNSKWIGDDEVESSNTRKKLKMLGKRCISGRAPERCLTNSDARETRIWATNKQRKKKNINRFIIRISFCVLPCSKHSTIFSSSFVFSCYFFSSIAFTLFYRKFVSPLTHYLSERHSRRPGKWNRQLGGVRRRDESAIGRIRASTYLMGRYVGFVFMIVLSVVGSVRRGDGEIEGKYLRFLYPKLTFELRSELLFNRKPLRIPIENR